MMTTQNRRKRLACGVIGLSIMAALALGLGRGGQAQPDTKRYLALLRPLKYTAIVLASNSQDKALSVEICSETARFPIQIPPGETVIIPFPEGWRTGDPRGWADRAVPQTEYWIESRGVPFGNVAEGWSRFASPGMMITAWGIDENGPQPFTYTESRN